MLGDSEVPHLQRFSEPNAALLELISRLLSSGLGRALANLFPLFGSQFPEINPFVEVFMLKINSHQGMLLSLLTLALCQLPAHAQADLYRLSYARSLNPAVGPKAETVVSIVNTNPVPCDLQVNWLNPAGAVIGMSGPVAVPPNGTLEFTTANMAEVIQPILPDVFRNTNTNFEGSALIFTPNCPADTLLGVNATMLSYYPPNFVANVTAPAYMPISVTRFTPGFNPGAGLLP
jgi:hypothetical protein